MLAISNKAPNGARIAAASCTLLSRATVDVDIPVIMRFIQVNVHIFPILVNGNSK